MRDLAWSKFLQMILLFVPFIFPSKGSFWSDAVVNQEQAICDFQVLSLSHMHPQNPCLGFTVGWRAGAHYTPLVVEIMWSDWAVNVKNFATVQITVVYWLWLHFCSHRVPRVSLQEVKFSLLLEFHCSNTFLLSCLKCRLILQTSVYLDCYKKKQQWRN